MTTLKNLKNRIHAIGETKKITTAMMLVAGSKLRRAEENLQQSIPFISGFESMLKILSSLDNQDKESERLLKGTGSDKIHLILVMSSDRGLCGAFNSTIIRDVKVHLNGLRSQDKIFQILPLGRKGEELLKGSYGSFFMDGLEDFRILEDFYEKSRLLRDRLVPLFESGVFDKCTLFFSKFHSVVQQSVEKEELYPIAIPPLPNDIHHERQSLYEFEPQGSELARMFLKDFLMTRLLYGFLETRLSEQGARMMAMDGAVKNAKEMIKHLKLTYNRSRQTSITTELIEIISGAEAL